MVFFSALLSLPFRFSSSPRMAVQFLLFLFCRCFLGFVFKVYVVGPIWGSLAPALGERVCWHDVNISGSHCYIWWFPLLLGTVWLTLPCIPFLFASVGGFSWLCQQFLSFFACCMYVFWSLLWFSGHCWALICSVLFAIVDSRRVLHFIRCLQCEVVLVRHGGGWLFAWLNLFVFGLGHLILFFERLDYLLCFGLIYLVYFFSLSFGLLCSPLVLFNGPWSSNPFAWLRKKKIWELKYYFSKKKIILATEIWLKNSLNSCIKIFIFLR